MLKQTEFIHDGYYLDKEFKGYPIQLKLSEIAKYISDDSLCLFPIKLTDEWLPKFKINSTDWFHENSYKIMKDENFGYTLKVRNANHDREIEFGYFTYVHELQRVLLSIGFDYS